jgi:hypothetical protein
MSSRTFLSSLLLIVFLCSNSLAQQTKQLPNQTGWLLEITYLKGAPPAYERVRLPGSKARGDWFGRFGHVMNWQLPDGAQPILAVRISNRLRNDETIRVRVSVMRGEKYLDTEETVATYDLRENEKVVVESLKDFGVEPFELRPFKTEPLAANQPVALNKTTSVEVIGIEQVASDTPEYKLSLHNLSAKTVSALYVDIVDEQRRVMSAMPQGLEGRPLILGGETTQIWLPLAVRAGGKTGGAYGPTVPTRQQFVIRLAIFGDGTTEGTSESEIQSGAGFQSVRFGEKVALQRALPLVAAALESTDAVSSDGASKLRSQLEQINLGITEAELVELQQGFPTREAKVLKEWVEFGIHVMRKEMLERLARFEDGAKRKDFRSWLTENRERYSNWEARLEPAQASQP